MGSSTTLTLNSRNIMHAKILVLYYGLTCWDSRYKHVLYLSYSGNVVDQHLERFERVLRLWKFDKGYQANCA